MLATIKPRFYFRRSNFQGDFHHVASLPSLCFRNLA
jgi:hypothetical protein